MIVANSNACRFYRRDGKCHRNYTANFVHELKASGNKIERPEQRWGTPFDKLRVLDFLIPIYIGKEIGKGEKSGGKSSQL